MFRSPFAKICLLHSLLLWFAIPVSSQTFISLSDKRAAIKNPKFYISEIIDARSNKEIVGIVQRGINNKPVIAQLKSGFQDEVRKCLTEFLQPKTDRSPLIIRVLKLNVFERTLLTSETAIAELVVEFFKNTDWGLILVKSAGSTIMSNGLDVTRSHGRNIELCFADCLSQVNTVLSEQLLASASTIAYKELFKTPDVLDKYEYPIVDDTLLVKGVYKNFIEFRDNAPGITSDFSIKEKANYTGAAYDATRGVVKTLDGKVSNVWGYSDEKRIFIKLGEEFFEVFEEDGIFWFEGYDISDYKTNLSIPGKSLVMAAFTGYLFYQVQVGWNSRKVKYAINLGNGDLISLN
ncbi:MAG: hypothetical protein WKF87_15985 [Chryseolinea sp.]